MRNLLDSVMAYFDGLWFSLRWDGISKKPTRLERMQERRFTRLIVRAANIVKRWDRESLGGLSVGDKTLTGAVMSSLAVIGSRTSEIYGTGGASYLLEKLNGITPETYAEISFHAGYGPFKPESIDHLAMLMSVRAHPEYIPYFAVGLRDEDVIRRCIADDIDAELAVRL